jgi:hypothetical protein
MLTAQLSLPRNSYQDLTSRLVLLDRLLPALQNQPGVHSTAIGTSMPFGEDNNSGSVSVEGVMGEMRHAHRRNGVAGDYWQAMGIPLLEGRFLEGGRQPQFPTRVPHRPGFRPPLLAGGKPAGSQTQQRGKVR